MKSFLNIVNAESVLRHEQSKPTFLLISSVLLVCLHRVLGSTEFAHQSFASFSDSAAALYMFTSAFVLFGLVPLTVIILLFRDTWKNYGVTLGDWKKGIFYVSILFPVISITLLFPASHTAEIRAF